MTDIILPKIEEIDDYAFSHCAPASVYLPASLRKIGVLPFEGCQSLSYIEIAHDNQLFESIDGALYKKSPNSELIVYPQAKTDKAFTCNAAVIGAHAFLGSNIEEVFLPKAQEIKKHAFDLCCSLKKAVLPASLARIDRNPFMIDFWTALETIEVDPVNPYFESVDGVLYTKGQGKLITCPGAGRRDFSNDSVTEVEECAFSTCGRLTNISMPSVETVGDFAFQGCTNLMTLLLPNVSRFGKYAFDCCSELRIVQLGAITPFIGDDKFDLFNDALPENNL
jgi:hypothetical protein